MTDETLMQVLLNPFSPRTKKISSKGPVYSKKDLIQFLFSPNTKSDVASLTARYDEINKNSNQLWAIPTDKLIQEKLIYPLRNAKASFVAGNYLGCISLCGIVAEMSSILIYKIADIKINEKKS